MRGAVLVGATDGIGLALARVLVEEGWRVAVLGRDPGKLAARVRELGAGDAVGSAAGVVCDVADRERAEPALEEALAAVGQLDLLVYCAGAMAPEVDGGERRAAVEPLVEVNLVGAVDHLELGARYLVEAGRGRLAAIGSVAGERGRKGHPVYAASKAGLHQYLEGLRHRLHGTGVGVTTVKPGWVRTRMLGARQADSPMAVEPRRAAEIVARRLIRGADVVWVPFWWRFVGAGLRVLPTGLYVRAAPP